MIGLGSSIASLAEFNRRAGIALKGVDSGEFEGWVHALVRELDRGGDLDSKRQQQVYRTVLRYRSSIADRLVIEYAELNVRGA